MGGGDLYLARRADDGTWLPARHLPAPINSDKLDYCPFVDGPRGNFYFTSERRVDTLIRRQPFDVHMLRNVDEAPGNGFGDIYRVSVKGLGWD